MVLGEPHQLWVDSAAKLWAKMTALHRGYFLGSPLNFAWLFGEVGFLRYQSHLGKFRQQQLDWLRVADLQMDTMAAEEVGWLTLSRLGFAWLGRMD